MKTRFQVGPLSVGLALGALSTSCSDGGGGGDDGARDGDASLELFVESEDVITSGIEAGDGLENIRDGWSVHFDKYLVAIGHPELRLSTDAEVEVHSHEQFIVDLVQVPASGWPLWSFDGLTDGRWNLFYEVAPEGAERHESVMQEDFDTMVAGDASYLVVGHLHNDDGRSCPPASLADVPSGAESNGENAGGDLCYPAPEVQFTFAVEAEVVYGPCEIDGLPGVALTDGRTTSAALTIHGDHIFFNGFPEGSEGGVTRLAQWLADCDLDLDGTVTAAELMAITPGDLSELDDRYQLGGSPITPLDNMLTYVQAQLMTQGHFQGEGECALNGVEHEHDH